MISGFLSFLGLARKANRVIFGAESVMMNANRIKLLLVASDAGNSSRRNASHLAEKHGFKCLETSFGKAQLGYSIGCGPCALIGITDPRFAERIIEKNTPT